MSFLNKYKSLDPERQEAFKARLSSDPEFREKTKGAVADLTAADKAEFKSLLTGGEIDTSRVPQGQIEQKLISEIPKEEGFVESAISTMENVVGNVAQTATDFATAAGDSVPFVTDALNYGVDGIVSGVESAVTGEGFSETFDRNRAETKAIVKNERDARDERSPIASTAGTVFGTAATLAYAAPSASVRALQLAKNLGASTKVLQATQLGAVTGTDFIYGALQLEAGRDVHSMETMAESMKTSGMYAATGAGIGVIVGKSIGALGNIRDSKYTNLAMSRGVQKLYTGVKTFVNKSVQYGSARSQIDEKAYVALLDQIPDYTKYVKAGEMTKATTAVDTALNTAVGKKIAVEKALLTTGVGADKLHVTQILEENIEALRMSKQNAQGGSESAIKAMQERITDIAESVGEVVPFSMVDDVLKMSEKWLKPLETSVKDRLQGNLRGTIHGALDIYASGGNKAVSELAESYSSLDKAIRVYKNNSDLSKSVVNELTDVTSSGAIKQIIGAAKDSVKTPGGAATAYFSKGASVLSNMVGLSKVSRNFVNGIDALERGVALTEDVSKFFTTGGGRATKTGQTLVSSFGRAIDSGETGDQLEKRITVMRDAASLLRSPMDRDTKSFYAKKDALLSLVEGIQPELAKQLAQIIENGENVGPFMEQIANNPKASEIFTPGQGWDGKTYDPALKKQIKDKILLMPLIPSAQRNQILEELQVNGTIPDMNALPQRVPRKQ